MRNMSKPQDDIIPGILKSLLKYYVNLKLDSG